MNVVREFPASRKSNRWTSLPCTLNEYFCCSVPRLFRHNRNYPLRTERNNGCPFVIEPYCAPARIAGIQAGAVNCDFAPRNSSARRDSLYLSCLVHFSGGFARRSSRVPVQGFL